MKVNGLPMLIAGALLSATTVFADAAAPAGRASAAARMKSKEAWERVRRHTGGHIIKPNSAKGRIVFLNARSKPLESEMKEIIKILMADMPFDYVTASVEGMAKYAKPGRDAYAVAKEELDAGVLVVFVDDPAAPTMTAAPEDGLAVVNVARLADGLATEASKEKFLPSRIRKEALRALAYACGSGGTTFPGNVLAITKVADLDYCKEFIPFDAKQNMKRVLAARSITPTLRTTYLQACTEGWAPQPTNEYQQAVWKQVHELPAKPIEIKFDPKKDK